MATRFRATATLAGLALLIAAGTLRAEETMTAYAFAVVTTEGEVVETPEGNARITGTVTGPMFVDEGHGPVDAGDLSCEADMLGDLETGGVTGQGACVMTARDGAKVFATWTCEGYAFVGCNGDFTVTGGEGRLEGIHGGGAMTWRSSGTQFEIGEADTAATWGEGIVFWKELTLVLP